MNTQVLKYEIKLFLFIYCTLQIYGNTMYLKIQLPNLISKLGLNCTNRYKILVLHFLLFMS